MNYNEFAENIKAKYPQYKDIDNRELAQRIVAKYPQYNNITFDDVVEEPTQQNQSGYKQMSLKEVFNATPEELNKNIKALGRQRLQERANWEESHPFISEIQKSFDPSYRPSLIDMQNMAEYGLQVPFGQSIKSEVQKFGQKLVPTANIGTAIYTGGLGGTAKGLLPSIGRGMLQGGIQGGVEGLTSGLADEGLSIDALNRGLSGLGAGTTVGGALETIPYIGKPLSKAMKLIPQTATLTAKTVGRIKPETLQRAVNPESIALDLTEPQATNLLMNTTERVRNAYNDILAKRGQEVGEAVKNLRNSDIKPIKTEDLRKDIISTFDQYQGGKINPARNMTGDLENKLLDLIESGNIAPDELVNLSKEADILGEFIPKKKKEAYKILARATGKSEKWLKTQLGSKSSKKGVGKRQQTIEEMLENTSDRLTDLPASEYDYYKPIGDASDTDLARRAYDDIMNNRFYQQANPQDVMFNEIENGYKDILNNFIKNQNEDMAYVQLENLTRNLSDDMKFDFIEQLANDIDSLNNSNTVNPIDLQKIKEQVGKMAKWGDETSREYSEPIARQIYGKFQNRLSNLSPELAQANKRFSDVVNFKKNEGLKSILRAGDTLDTASRTLRNYNSTITKGNTARNIQDLENLLVGEGYEPFLNQIDDINAAMDLLNIEKTGDSWLANYTKQATKPLLKLYRGLNRLEPTLQPLRQNVSRLVTPTAVGLTIPLQGGIVYNEDRY